MEHRQKHLEIYYSRYKHQLLQRPLEPKHYLSIRYTDRSLDAGVQPSAGRVGYSYDNALAETINGLYKAEVTPRRSWPDLKAVELTTLEWVHWYNLRRRLGPLDYLSPAEAEDAYNRNQALPARAA
jgi:putative transposase